MNPDGQAAQDRHNANQVDLNRNFPYKWGADRRAGDGQYAGTGPASEPETQAMVNFIAQLRPDIAIWYHQDLYVISPAEGREGRIRARYAELTGLPMGGISGGTYTGIAATWARRELAADDSVAFIVELGADALVRGGGACTPRRCARSPSRADRYAKSEADHGTAAVAVAGEHSSAVTLGDVAHDRQSQTRPGHRPRLVGAVEALEHQRQLALGDARSAIGDGDAVVVRRVTSIGPSPGSNLRALSSRHDSARCTAARWATTRVGSPTTMIRRPVRRS